MQGIFDFFTAILKKITDLASWVLSVISKVFESLWHVVTDLGCWLFEGLLGIAVSALQAIDAPFNPQTYYAMIPPDVANMLGVIGLPQALSIIVSALVVRFILQTIPLVRWGS